MTTAVAKIQELIASSDELKYAKTELGNIKHDALLLVGKALETIPKDHNSDLWDHYVTVVATARKASPIKRRLFDKIAQAWFHHRSYKTA